VHYLADILVTHVVSHVHLKPSMKKVTHIDYYRHCPAIYERKFQTKKIYLISVPLHMGTTIQSNV